MPMLSHWRGPGRSSSHHANGDPERHRVGEQGSPTGTAVDQRHCTRTWRSGRLRETDQDLSQRRRPQRAIAASISANSTSVPNTKRSAEIERPDPRQHLPSRPSCSSRSGSAAADEQRTAALSESSWGARSSIAGMIPATGGTDEQAYALRLGRPRERDDAGLSRHRMGRAAATTGCCSNSASKARRRSLSWRTINSKRRNRHAFADFDIAQKLTDTRLGELLTRSATA